MNKKFFLGHKQLKKSKKGHLILNKTRARGFLVAIA